MRFRTEGLGGGYDIGGLILIGLSILAAGSALAIFVLKHLVTGAYWSASIIVGIGLLVLFLSLS